MSEAFFDSNVLLYGYAANDPRSERARELVGIGGAISVQCLNEFASVARRKLGMSWERTNESLSIIVDLCEPVVPLDLSLHQAGMLIAEARGLSIYDSMIVAAALTAGCNTLYSEDMHDGHLIEGRLRIVNPFRG